MKKILLSLLLLICCLFITGCSSNVGIKRKSNAKEDEIRFFSLEWLTKKEDVEKAFDEKFGKGTYIVDENLDADDINPPLYSYCVRHFGLGEEEFNKLNWDIGGYKTNQINVFYLSDDYKEKYMYRAIIWFSDNDNETYLELRSKLKDLYTEKETENTDVRKTTRFEDKNNNTAILNYVFNPTLSSDPYIQLSYNCGDINNYIEEQREIYYQQKKENNKKETRKENPDL